ncbi:MAG: hypothetical protein DMF90_13870 [Acidobacteria bacterium]|nr:MAG: hypothetical protein DMF90_13870 [Acidobacteriota bacterium]
MTPDGEVTVMHHFVGGADGAYPTTTLLQAKDGNLYGTTLSGGGGSVNPPFYGGAGTVYRVTPYGDYAVIHRFDGVHDGGMPNASLVQRRDDSLYSATPCGIPMKGGALFRLTSAGATVTLAFNNGYCSDDSGTTPNTLLAAFDGTLYWATGNFSVFALSPEGRWRFVDVIPDPTLMQAADGHVYGTTTSGGAASAGTVFRLAQPVSVVSQARSVLGDFDGDGKVDLVWRENLPFGDLAVWLMDGAQPKQGPVLAQGLNVGMALAGVGDLDGDGKADLIWRNSWDGTLVVWLMNGLTVRPQSSTIASSVPLAWQIVGVADLDGDHKADLIWRHTQTGAVAVWLMDGATVKEAPVVAPGVPLAWEIAGVGDLDGDGKADLVWRHTPSGDVAVWLMDGVRVKQAPVISPGVPLTWQIAGVGDLDGDGKADLVWRHTQSGDVAVWLMNGLIATQTPVIATSVLLAWDIAGVGDLDADGKADLIWRQSETGDLAAWLMSGVTVKQSEVIAPGVPLTWQLE